MIKKLRLLAAFVLLANIAFGQASQSGEIYGRVTDDKNQPLDFVTVVASIGGITKGGSKTDLNGNYKVKPLAPGKYDVKISYAGYGEQVITGITVGADARVKIDATLAKKIKELGGKDGGPKVIAYKQPLISNEGPVRGITRDEIKNTANNNSVTDLVSMSSNTYQNKSNGAISVAGDRSSGTIYMIDGVPVRVRDGNAGVNLPTSSIDQLELIGNGMSAKYGNATGGVVNLTTRGIQSKFSGSVQAQHSLEGYNNNLLTVDIAGPLLRSGKGANKRPVLGYSFNAAVTYDKDNNPTNFKNYKLTDAAKARLETNPLIPNPNGSFNFISAATTVTESDFKRVIARDNASSWGTNLVGKLDFQPTENLSFSLFSNFANNQSNDYSFFNSLFSPQANPLTSNYTSRNYIRMTQRLGKSNSQLKEGDKKSPITNAYYSIQLIYQKDFNDRTNKDHGDNLFQYGYLGKFQSFRTPFYRLDTSVGGYRGVKFQSYLNDSVTFTPAGINPILENYSKALFADGRVPMRNLSDLRQFGGLRNGDAIGSIYSQMWSDVGNQNGLYTYRNADQVNVNLEASFDIEQGSGKASQKDMITHNIQFGLGYEQRTTREYRLVPGGLWNVMRLNTNRQFSELDLANPIYSIGGQNYTKADLDNGVVTMSQFDTINYNPLYSSTQHSRFDKELRKKLSLEGGELNTTFLDIDNMSPSTFSLNMFEADDLFNNGQEVASYYGYDYLGNKQNKQPSFNDFWTKKDARGDFARPIGAFRPIYMFGYILDKFSYKNLNFNVGLRLDRYDANTKVLRDPYSLYGIRKNSDIIAGSYATATDASNGAKAPLVSELDKDYVPYINSNQAEIPTIVGYRKGDNWYDPFGKEISDPTVLSSLYAGGNQIQPWLQDKTQKIKNADYKVDNAFEDYKPQVSLSPRIKFSFPINEDALFYGNYDVITQQPSSSNLALPSDYFYLEENAQSSRLQNANLKMERAVNYSLGYQQKLSPKAALTVEAYYRERRNQIQLQQMILAYPIGYQTFGNRDFASTKGTTVSLDFRRNGPLRVKLDYTLQFAEGTGSNTTSANSLLASGQPNLRTVFPLNNDSRHNINARIDYRFAGDKSGPKIGKSHPFANAGANLIIRARAGEPYTRSALATPVVGGDFNSKPIIGGINGSNLPWNYELNLKLDKSVKLANIGRKKDAEGKVTKLGEPFYINFYVLVSNLLNTRNIIANYGYTGLGDDDGYLTSPQGVQFLSALQYQEAYRTLYQARLLNPDNFNNPRRINVGLSFDF